MNNSQRIVLFGLVTLILLGGTIFFAAKYTITKKELNEAQETLATRRISEKTLAFTKLFIEEVLKSKTEVDFETRLRLENAVRDIGDDQILSRWQKFTESKTEIEAQEEVKNLLGVLMEKIEIRE